MNDSTRMKSITSLRVAFFVASFAALVISSVSAAPITIDNFSAPTSGQTLNATSGSPTILTTKDSSILGGQRQVMLTVAGAPGAASQSGLLRGGVDPGSLWGGGTFNWGSASGPGTTVNLLYAGLNNAGLGGVDLTSGGTENELDLEFGKISAGPNPTDGNNDTMHFQVIVYEGDQGGNVRRKRSADGRDGCYRSRVPNSVRWLQKLGVLVFEHRRSEHQFWPACTAKSRLPGSKAFRRPTSSRSDPGQPPLMPGVHPIPGAVEHRDGRHSAARPRGVCPSPDKARVIAHRDILLKMNDTTHMKRITSLRVAFLVASFAALVISHVAAAPVTIDNFTAPTPAQTPSATSGSPTIFTTKDAGILGGQRQALFTVAGTPGSSSTSGSIGGGGFLWGSNTDSGTTVNLLYAGPNNTGLGGVDLTGGGTDSGLDFHFAVVDASPNPTDGNNASMHLQVLAYEGSNVATYDVNVPSATSDGLDFFVPFNGFTNQGVSFASVDALSISFGLLAQGNVDFVLLGIVASIPTVAAAPGVHAVPEPSSMVMTAMALVGLVAFVGRRAKCYAGLSAQRAASEQ